MRNGEEIRLTAMTSAAGWAAQRGSEALALVLRPRQNLFPAERYPRLLVGLDRGDDAAVYQVSEGVAIIQTLGFFPSMPMGLLQPPTL